MNRFKVLFRDLRSGALGIAEEGLQHLAMADVVPDAVFREDGCIVAIEVLWPPEADDEPRTLQVRCGDVARRYGCAAEIQPLL